MLLAAEDVDDELAGTEDELAIDDEITAAADDELAGVDEELKDELDVIDVELTDTEDELFTAVGSSNVSDEADDALDFDELLGARLLELLDDDDELAGGVSLLSLPPPQAVMVKTIALISKSFFIA